MKLFHLSLPKTSSLLLSLAVSLISLHTFPGGKNVTYGGPMPFCKMILVFVRGLLVSRAKLSLELLALRHQLVVWRRTV